jgi:hypothetical protein
MYLNFSVELWSPSELFAQVIAIPGDSCNLPTGLPNERIRRNSKYLRCIVLEDIGGEVSKGNIRISWGLRVRTEDHVSSGTRGGH